MHLQLVTWKADCLGRPDLHSRVAMRASHINLGRSDPSDPFVVFVKRCPLGHRFSILVRRMGLLLRKFVTSS